MRYKPTLDGLSSASLSSLKMGPDNLPDMSLGDNIRALRRQFGWSLAELGTRVGVSAQAVGQWENGGNMTRQNLQKLGDIFGVTVEEISARRTPVGKKNLISEGDMVDKNLSLAALRVTISILRPDLSMDDAQALAAIFLSLALTPEDSASQASFEDRLRAQFQGALAARSVEQ